jgi:hypothetical protein
VYPNVEVKRAELESYQGPLAEILKGSRGVEADSVVSGEIEKVPYWSESGVIQVWGLTACHMA